MGAKIEGFIQKIVLHTSGKEGLGFLASSCVMSSLISALTSLLADRPRSVPNRESSSCACMAPKTKLTVSQSK